MNRQYLLWEMQHALPVNGWVCNDEEYNYYQLGVCGYLLFYRQRRLRPDGRRCYYLTDQLAKALNFDGLYEMHYYLPTIQYWRKFVSVERLRVALERYDDKWKML